MVYYDVVVGTIKRGKGRMMRKDNDGSGALFYARESDAQQVGM